MAGLLYSTDEWTDAKETAKKAGRGNYIDESPYTNSQARYAANTHNRESARLNFVNSRYGGHLSDDPYERAQQEREYRKTADFKKYYDPLSPQTQMLDRLGDAAYSTRHSLRDDQNEAANSIKRNAGSQMDEGLRKLRSGASNRGLLYSGLRQGAEGDFRSKVANTMASQVSQSNADLSKRADSMDQAAATAAIQGEQRAMESQRMAEQMARENAVARAQQMQQLGGLIGYGFGQWAGGSGGETSQNPNVVSRQRYVNEAY